MARTTDTGTADAVRAELARRRRSGRDLAKAVGLPERTLRRRLGGDTQFTATEIAAVAQFLELPVEALVRPRDGIQQEA